MCLEALMIMMMELNDQLMVTCHCIQSLVAPALLTEMASVMAAISNGVPQIHIE